MNGARHGGFTLVELLVALALLALLMVTLHGGLRAIGQGWERSYHAARTVADRDHLRHLLRARLEQARPLRVTDGSGRTYLQFTGTRESVHFVTPLPQQLLPGGDYRIGLTLHEDALVLGYEPLWWDQPREASLLIGVQSIRFDYLGADGWRDEWLHEQVLPALIRLQLVLADGAQFELIAEPKAGTPEAGHGL